MARFPIAMFGLLSLVLVLSAASPAVCEAASLPSAAHGAGHGTALDSGCPTSMTPLAGSAECFALVSLDFLSSKHSLSVPFVFLSPDPLPPEA